MAIHRPKRAEFVLIGIELLFDGRPQNHGGIDAACQQGELDAIFPGETFGPFTKRIQLGGTQVLVGGQQDGVTRLARLDGAHPGGRPPAGGLAGVCPAQPHEHDPAAYQVHGDGQNSDGDEDGVQAHARLRGARVSTGQNMTRANGMRVRASVNTSGHLLAEDVGAELVSQPQFLLLGDGLVVSPLGYGRPRHAEKTGQLGLAHAQKGEQFGLGHGGT